MAGPIPAPPFRPGSKLAAIDAYLRNNPLQWSHGPVIIAGHLTLLFGVRVTKQDVWYVLKHTWGHTRKLRSVVPARSRPQQRLNHLVALRAVWTRDDQIVFVDEKTWLQGEVKERINKHGYAARGVRVPLRTPFPPYLQAMPDVTGVVGALSLVAPAPMLEGGLGDVGLFTYFATPGG